MKGKKLLTYVLASSMSVSLFAGMTMTVGAQTIDNASVSNDEQDSSENVNLDELFAESEKATADEAIEELADNFNSGINEDGSADLSAYDYQEGSEAEELATLDDETYPAAVDLRHYGGTVTYNEETKKNDVTGGTSYVTPTKFQNPWGTCWAFGITAAAETSVLSELDQAGQGVDSKDFDFSEHHLAWFAKNALPTDGSAGYVNNQEGEGVHYKDETMDPNEKMASGFPYFGTTAYAAGMGVVIEDYAPYRGKNGIINAYRRSTAEKTKYPDSILYVTMDEWNAFDQDKKDSYILDYTYSSNDDWTLDESQRFAYSFALEESSILPAAKGIIDSETKEVTLNEDGVNAIKAELNAGRGVTMGYVADGNSYNSNRRYINDNYAQYCWDGTGANHCVCIVGYDDDYDASNFGSETVPVWDKNNEAVYRLKDSGQTLTFTGDSSSRSLLDEDGKVIAKYSIADKRVEQVTESGENSTPPGNGAWIVKNSWGGVDSEFPNKYSWGVDGSGYFYLSYYDTSISKMESYDFIVTDEETEEYDYSIIDQYDYMTAGSTAQSTTYVPAMMANIFTAAEDMEIDAVSCETTTPGTVVAYGIILLDDDEDYPSDEDEFEFLETEPYEYGGYHRHEIETPVVVSEGQKYAVVVMEYYQTIKDDGSTLDNFYICSHSGASSSSMYTVGVINPGESYIGTYAYNSDELNWTDYRDFVTMRNASTEGAADNQYDNFSLKAYGKPTDKSAPVLESAVNTKDGVKVSWESKGDGYNYRIFCREAGAEKWQVIADTDDTSYVVNGLKSGTEYEFTVRCTDETGMHYITLYDKTGVSCTCLSYLSSKANAVSDGINVSWTKTSGASGYNIYRKSGTSDYEALASVNGNVSSYKDTSAKQGVLYSYKVKAYVGSDESASNTVSALTLKTPTLKLSSTKSRTVTVKWSKNSKATGYQIKYKVGSKTKYITIKKASTVKKVLKKLKKGKICKVKVRSYKTVSGKTYYSGWSKLKKVKVK